MSVRTIPNFLEFLKRLKAAGIYYRLDQVRDDAILVDVAVPGERWEVEFMDDGRIDVERFKSDGGVKSETELEVLFNDFSD